LCHQQEQLQGARPVFGAPELKGLDGENLGEITIEATQTGGLTNKIVGFNGIYS